MSPKRRARSLTEVGSVGSSGTVSPRLGAAIRLPRFGDADEHPRRSRADEGFHQRGRRGSATADDQRVAEFRIGGERAQFGIILLVGRGLFRRREHGAAAGAIEFEVQRDAIAHRAVAMQMGDDDRAAVETHESRPPGLPLAEKEFAGHAPDRAGDDDAAAFHIAPFQRAG